MSTKKGFGYMNGCKKTTLIKAAAAGTIAAITVGLISECGVCKKVMPRSAKLKKGAKKALKTVDRYINNIM